MGRQQQGIWINNGAWRWEVSGLGHCPTQSLHLFLSLPELSCWLADVLGENREELGDGAERQGWGQA